MTRGRMLEAYATRMKIDRLSIYPLERILIFRMVQEGAFFSLPKGASHPCIRISCKLYIRLIPPVQHTILETPPPTILYQTKRQLNSTAATHVDTEQQKAVSNPDREHDRSPKRTPSQHC